MLQAIAENLLPAWTGGGGERSVLPLHTSHLNEDSNSGVHNPEIVSSECSVRARAGLCAEPPARLAWTLEGEQSRVSSRCSGRTLAV